MIAKLTLSMDSEIIEIAKDIGRMKKKSVSKIVEEHFRELAKVNSARNSYVKTLSGSLNGEANSTVTVKEAKGRYLKAKHGL